MNVAGSNCFAPSSSSLPRSFLTISRRLFAYCSTIRSASSAREGLRFFRHARLSAGTRRGIELNQPLREQAVEFFGGRILIDCLLGIVGAPPG